MAVNNTENSYSKMEFPMSISRQDAFALDPSSVWSTLADAQDYAQNNPTAYVGQIIAVVADGESILYQIKNTAGDLEQLGTGSGTEIEIATDDEVTEMLDEIFGSTTE